MTITPDRARAIGIGANALAVLLQTCAALILALAGVWEAVTLPAIGAGISAGVLLVVVYGAERQRLWVEKTAADIEASKHAAAIYQRQHELMMRDIARAVGAPEQRH